MKTEDSGDGDGKMGADVSSKGCTDRSYRRGIAK